MTGEERAAYTALMTSRDFPVVLPPRPAWMADAACREHPEVDFFPTPANALPARLVCFDCIVREECGAYGRENGEVGVWGGQLLKAPRLPAPSTRRRRGVDLDALAAQTRRWQRKALAARAKRAG